MPQPEVLPADEHNRQLLSLVHPSGWVNPTPSGRYNLVVIGGGAAGLVSAIGAAGLGARVALIESRLMGGDCLNWGCVPSKALIASARRAAHAHSAGALGVQTGTVSVDFPAVMARMRRLRARIAHHDSFARVRAAGVDAYLGSARFSSRSTVSVGGQELRFSRAIIATGAHPYIPPIPGVAEVEALTNETLFQLTACPAHLIVVGGGPVGTEMAQVFRRFGAQVTLIDRADRILSRDDPDAAAIVQHHLHTEGVDLRLGVTVSRFSRAGPSRNVHLSDGTMVTGDAVLLATGRRPTVTSLGLEEADVEYDRHGLRTDDTLRSLTNPRVYAAGDVVGRGQYTHAADEMARIALQNALFFGRRRLSAVALPRATYTDPALAHVGIPHHEADARSDVSAFTVPFSAVDRMVLEGEEAGFVRLYADTRGRFLGGTVVGAGAGSLIGALSVALQGRLTMDTLAHSIHPYPTAAEAIRRAAGAWRKERLTPSIAALLRTFLRVRR